MKNRRPEPRLDFGLKDVQEYLEVPLRRPLWVIVPMVLTLAVAVAVAFWLPRRYRSSTLILVESEKVPDNFVPRISTESMGRRLHTIRQEILSRTRLERVLAELDPYPSVNGEAVPLSQQVERMRGSITVETKGSDAFTVSYSHTDPATAMIVANRLTTLFIEEAESEREQQANEGFEFIDSQLAQMRSELEEKEQTVRLFKEKYLGSLPEQLATNLATLQRLQLEQQTVEESLRAARARVDTLRQQQASSSAVSMGEDPAREELAELRAQLAQLRARYTDQHPDVQSLSRRITELERRSARGDTDRRMPRAQEEQLQRAEVEVEELVARRETLGQEMTRIQARVDAAPGTEQRLTTLTRDYAQLQDSYMALLKKQMDARMAQQMERQWKGERFKILDPAHLPDRPYSPNRTLFALAGLVAGLGLGLACAFAAELLDHSIKHPDQIEEILGQPLLASIPDVAAGPRPRWGR